MKNAPQLLPLTLPTEITTTPILTGLLRSKGKWDSRPEIRCAAQMANGGPPKVINSHLHVWASPQQAAEKYPCFPGQEPTLPGHVEFLIECMGEAGVDGALIVQPINHKFDHSYVTSMVKQYPSKFIGCCLANPAEDGTGVKELEDLISKDGYRAVRFNPYLWPSGQLFQYIDSFYVSLENEHFSGDDVLSFISVFCDLEESIIAFNILPSPMTNEVGKAMFAKAGELGVPVGFMCMKGLQLHLSEIEQLCTEFPSTVVLLDHMGFCKPPLNYDEEELLSKLLSLSRFPQVYVKFSALFRVSRYPYPYVDLSNILSKVVSSYGANRIMWGSDFPYVVSECGYKEAKEAVHKLIQQAALSASETEWIMPQTICQVFNGFVNIHLD